MAIRPILRIGDPRLREVATPVEAFDTPELHELIEDMFETMEAADGAGLAATQIGELKRVMIFSVDENPRYPEADVVPTTVLVNPEFSVISDEIEGFWEGCLSVPGMRGYVERRARIKYTGYDQFGMLIEREAEGFHAVVFQHEYDHFDGILYTDRLADPKKFGFVDELAAAETDQ
jgi:peptide deformylase